MTPTQQVFVVFFAIFWGGIFNVLGRWKMFNWPLAGYPQVRHRLVLSGIMFNVVPVLTFAWFFCLLRNTPPSLPSTMNTVAAMLWIVAGVVPAFAVFGCYRFWLAIVECCPETFYLTQGTQDELQGVDPTIECLRLNPKWACRNCFAALFYFSVAVLAVFLAWYNSPIPPVS